MKYLKLFETESEYQAYIESGEMILPNVSYIREFKRCDFKPYVDVSPKVTLNYNSTEDNLFAFSNGSLNIKSLKIDGKNIEFPPIVTGTSTVEILASEVSYNAETELYEFPDNYSITSVPTSLVIKPKDSSIKVTDANIGFVLFMSYAGMKMCELLSLSDAEGMIVIDEVNNQITFTDLFLQEMEYIISMGYGYGFGLCNIIDLDSYQFDIIDSIQIYEGTSGGIVTPYYFETPGMHTVEMELLNGDFGQMYMFYNMFTEESAPLTSVIFNKNITSISQYTFVYNRTLSEITCESEIAPAINYSFVEIGKFGTLHYPEGSDYSSWLEGEGSLFEYGWNKEQPILTAKYNITNTTSPTKICDYTSNFTDIIIDGTPMSPLENSYTFSTTGEHEVIYKLDGTDIGWGSFENCSTLTAISIPDSVTSIGGNAFKNCSGLTCELVIPDSVNEIGDYAFYGCKGLTGELVIPDSVTSIGDYAFYGCKGLTGELVIPDSVTDIGSGAFSNCKGLTAITIPDSVNEIGFYEFYDCSGLTAITIPDSVTSIGYGAFYNCTGLTAITIPDSVTFINDKAFEFCSGLTSISLGNSVTSIGSEAFSSCRGLTAITCNATSAPVIDSDTFYGVNTFGTLNYPEGSDYSSWLRTDSYYLGYYSWNKEKPILTAKYNITDTTSPTALCHNTSDFTDIIIDGTPMSPLENSYTFSTTGEHEVIYKLDGGSISNLAFYGCSGLTAITISDSVTSIGNGSTFANCSGLTSIEVSTGNTRYDSRENCNCIIETSTNTLICGCKNSTIPNGVTSIGYNAFAQCYGLTEITIPNSVTKINNESFTHCSGLTKITLGNAVTSIGSMAFFGCSGLTTITCNATIAPTIYNNTFEGIKKNGTLYIPSGSDYSSWMRTDASYLGYYNWNIETPILTAKYNITNTTSPTKICDYTSNFTDIIIDGTPMSPLENSYTFSTTGEHEVIYKLKGFSIGGSIFFDCNRLTAITIPDGVNEIGASAFTNCTGLTAITIPDSVTKIGGSAFFGCSGLTTITCNATIAPEIKSSTFYNVKNNGTLYIPSGSDYSSWLRTDAHCLGYYNWTVEYI